MKRGLDVLLRYADGHGPSIDGAAEDYVAVVDDHVKQFVPGNRVLTFSEAGSTKDDKNGLYRAGYCLLDSRYVEDIRYDNVIDKGILRCIVVLASVSPDAFVG